MHAAFSYGDPSSIYIFEKFGKKNIFYSIFTWHYNNIFNAADNADPGLPGKASRCYHNGMQKNRFFLWVLKMRGKGAPASAPVPRYVRQSALGAGVTVGLMALAQEYVGGEMAQLMLIGSFGATAAMIFGLPAAPYSQPRNVLGGHVIAAFFGVTGRLIGHALPSAVLGPALGCALAVGFTIWGMHRTRCFHPPGGATALIAVIGGEQVYALGYAYMFMPVGIGMIFLVLLGVLINNLFPGRRYPLSWW